MELTQDRGRALRLAPGTDRQVSIGSGPRRTERPFWTPRDRRLLPAAIGLSALLQVSSLLLLPEPPPDREAALRDALSDRFITILLRPSDRRVVKPKEVEKRKEVAKTEAKRKEAKKKKKEKKRRKKARRRKPQEPPKARPKPLLAALPPPGPSPPASDALLGAGIVLDMELGSTGMSGGLGTSGGRPWGSGSRRSGSWKAGAGRGVSSGDGDAPVVRAFEVDRLPVCPELRPEYPDAARRQGLEGDVVLRLQIGKRGRVRRVSVKRGAGHGFDEAARAAALRMRCKPALRGGRPTAVRIDYEIAFRLVD